jgi:uncharacterized protein
VPVESAIVENLRLALEARPEVLDGYLFGSHARGDARADSDIDVAVFVEETALVRPGFGYAAELGADLQATLKRSDVDLVVLNRAPPLLYYRVLRDGIRLVARVPVETTGREGYALSRYFDYVPQLAKIDAAHRLRERSSR